MGGIHSPTKGGNRESQYKYYGYEGGDEDGNDILIPIYSPHCHPYDIRLLNLFFLILFNLTTPRTFSNLQNH